MKVLVVESPAKAKTINKYLGKDYEVLASFGHIRDLPAKWSAFGWNVVRCDGHDLQALCSAVELARATKGVPTVIIADTIKGKGVSFMEGKAAWHGKAISDEDYAKAMAVLGGDR